MPDDSVQINMDIGPVDRYISRLREEEAPERTVKRCARLLWDLAEAVGGEDYLLSVTEAEIRNAISARLPWKKDVILIWYAEVKDFFSFLVQEGLRKDNPLERDAVELHSNETFDMRQARNKLVRNATLEFNQLRDSVILALLRETDIRPLELRLLSLACYDRNLARLLPAPGRCILLNECVTELLEEYIVVFSSYVKLADAFPLFIDMENGYALPESHYWNLIRQDLRIAGAGASGSSLSSV
jgi:site-specific recombinase XerD